MNSKVLKAIMQRYKGLVPLFNAMQECEDTVLVNLQCDLNEEFTTDEILDEIHKAL